MQKHVIRTVIGALEYYDSPNSPFTVRELARILELVKDRSLSVQLSPLGDASLVQCNRIVVFHTHIALLNYTGNLEAQMRRAMLDGHSVDYVRL
jgi:DNA-binding transcriptional ArsR family regulator